MLHQSAGFGDLARQGRKRDGGAESIVSSSVVQPGGAPRRVQYRDGKDMSMKSNILQITTSSEKVPAAE
jgi:hypothetical protein